MAAKVMKVLCGHRASVRMSVQRFDMAKQFHAALHRLWRDERGQDMIEYALLAAAIAVVVAGFLPQTLMPSISTIFSEVVSSFAATPN
jgi:Flp pilus assembly pilin Flp